MSQNTNNVGWEENLFKPLFFAPSMCMTSKETSHGDVANISKQKKESDVSQKTELTGQDTQVCSILKFIVGCEEYCAKKSVTKGSEAKNQNSIKKFDSKILEMFNFTRQPQPEPQSREEELIKEIERVQMRLLSVTEQLENSKAERERLEWKINEVQNKIRKEMDILEIPVSDNPSEDELQYLEKLTLMAREKARRSRVLKALQEKENLLKLSMDYHSFSDVDSVTPANIPSPLSTNGHPIEFHSIDFLRKFGNSMMSSMRTDPSTHKNDQQNTHY